MNSLEIVALPAFADNYIWALRARGGAVAVVDPGDAAPVLAYLAATGTQLAAILVTHHHADHCGGIDDLLARHPAPVYGPALEAIDGVDRPLADGDQVALAGLGIEFEVLAVPGHTRGHIAYYRRGMLFCGDTLFGAGCGRLFEGTAATMHASLARIRALPADTQIYCAHEYTQANLRFAAAVEPDNAAIRDRVADTAQLRAAGRPSVPSTLAVEAATNPFLRWDAPAVIAAAQAQLGRPATDPIEIFAAVREWKNRF
ncbi:MAG: hydroxyacylglutathione hydrolase [Rhodocyclaceae bacterium]|nr:hydroxyacylglutathione hydrolase [Rhodocyclaceae bacterium]